MGRTISRVLGLAFICCAVFLSGCGDCDSCAYESSEPAHVATSGELRPATQPEKNAEIIEVDGSAIKDKK